MIPTQSVDQFGSLPPQTIVPHPVEDTDNFIQWMNRFYEEAALVMNNRVLPYAGIQISNIATDIPNLPTFGAFIVCVGGVYSNQPTGVWALTKSASGIAGLIAILQTQAGQGAQWAGINLTITSTATNYQIAHNLANVTDTFNISVFGTQLLNQ